MNTILRGMLAAGCVSLLAGCGALAKLSELGRPPAMAPITDPTKAPTWRPVTLPMPAPEPAPTEANSLWRHGSRAFLKDQRASQVGDTLTVLVNIADGADVENNSTRATAGSEQMGITNFFGVENVIPRIFGNHANPASLVNTNSASNWNGAGVIKRTDTVTLRLAAIVTQVLPNGDLVVTGRQQMRVNSELRDLSVDGIARPSDIASDNTISHDRLAEARIVYGGRGQSSDIQTPRWGQQLLDIVLPF
ncbi:MAG TPA: flagellar basal body L-ring protein FlgH [Acidisphaera sp.]|nr:flagellar basal body L-ring protein FlgH [Acidisphaera sp.]